MTIPAPSDNDWFDAECCLGIGPQHRRGAPVTASALVAELMATGIGRALVYHADAAGHDPVAGNRRLMDEVAEHPELEPCWVLLPDHIGDFPRADLAVGQMAAHGVRAARIFPKHYRLAFRMWHVGPLVSALAAQSIPLWVDFGHDGWSEEAIDYDGLHEVCGAVPTLPIVLVRPNIGSDRRVHALMVQHSNLYLETSYYTVHRGIELLCETFGPDRVLLGTGLPRRAPGPAVTALMYSRIDDATRARVAGGNLRRLLGRVRTTV